MSNLKQSWFTLSCLQLSGALSLPVIMIGYYIGQHYSFQQSLQQIMLGNSILFLLSLFYQRVINQKKMLTIEFARHLFGPTGTLICAAGMALSLIGWSAIQMQLIQAASGHTYLVGLLFALLIYFLTCKDLAYLALANKILLPIVGLCLGYLLIFTPTAVPSNLEIKAEPFKLGLMMVITAGSGLVFDLPTFYRHAATPKAALLSLTIIFLISLPLIETLGIYLATHYPQNNSWIQSLLNSINLPSLFFLILSGLLGTCLNLYSATMVVNRILGFSYKKTLFFCCFISALLSQLNLEKQFSFFLEIINLNAEVITVLILTYVAFKGASLPQPTSGQKKMHQSIFYLALVYAIATRVFRLSVFHDLFLDTAFISFSLMLSYYCLSSSTVLTLVSPKTEKANELS